MFTVIFMLALYTMPIAPAAPRLPFDVAAPGGVRTDFYYWLRDTGNPGTIPYLEEENAYAESFFAATGDIRRFCTKRWPAAFPGKTPRSHGSTTAGGTVPGMKPGPITRFTSGAGGFPGARSSFFST